MIKPPTCITHRSVVLETLYAIEGSASLVDDEGRGRTLEISRDVVAKCNKLSSNHAQAKLQREMQKAIWRGYLATVIANDDAGC